MSMNNPIEDAIENKIESAAKNAFFTILVAMIRPLATLTEVFLRKDMGERYFTAWNVAAGTFLLFLFGLPHQAIIFGPSGSYTAYGRHYRGEWGEGEFKLIISMLIWFGIFLFCAKLHQMAVIERYQKGTRWHSGCIGIPRIAGLPVLVERLLPIAGGILLIWPTRLYGLGGLMIFSGITTYFLRAYEAAKFRDRMLDMIDSQIEYDNLSKAIKERLSPENAEGVQAPLPAYVSDKSREQFARAITPAETSH